MNVYNNNWLGKTLNVISSQDNTLVGRQGMVIDESQKTITIKEDEKVCINIQSTLPLGKL